MIGAPVTLTTGNLTFNGAGVLTAPAADITIPGPATWANGATPNAIIWDVIPPVGGSPIVTSYAAPSATSHGSPSQVAEVTPVSLPFGLRISIS